MSKLVRVAHCQSKSVLTCHPPTPRWGLTPRGREDEEEESREREGETGREREEEERQRNYM